MVAHACLLVFIFFIYVTVTNRSAMAWHDIQLALKREREGERAEIVIINTGRCYYEY